MQQKLCPAQQELLGDNESKQLSVPLVIRSCSERMAAGLLPLQPQARQLQVLKLMSLDKLVGLVPTGPAELGAGLRRMQQSSTAQARLQSRF